MRIEFPDGASVSIIWGELSDGELLAAFQHDCDAIAFAKTYAQGNRLAEKSYLVVTDHCRGRVTVVRKPLPVERKEAA